MSPLPLTSSMRARFSALVVGLASVFGWAGPAQAQATDYPVRPIRLVVGFAAGSATDTIARAIATPLSQKLGQPIVIENRPGAFSVIAQTQVKRADADGYTLLLATNSGMVAAPAGLVAGVQYDPFKDFARIGQVATTGFTLSSGRGFKPETGPEVISYIKANPDKSFCAAANANGRMLCEALGRLVQSPLVVVPFKSSPEAVTALMSGEVQVMFVDLPSAVPRIRQGQIKTYGLVAEEPSQVMPQLPLAKDVGLGALPPFVGWYGLFGPASLPRGVEVKLTAALDEVLKQPDVRQQIIGAGFEPAFQPPAQLLKRMEIQYDVWKRLLKEYNIQPGS